MKSKLNEKDKLFFQGVLFKRQPELIKILTTTEVENLPIDVLDTFCQILTDELCETGLNNDSEPNERGLKIEELISFFNYYQFL